MAVTLMLVSGVNAWLATRRATEQIQSQLSKIGETLKRPPYPLTESVLIGNVAARFPGQTLEFDAKSLSFPKTREANQWLTRDYRKGWGVRA